MATGQLWHYLHHFLRPAPGGAQSDGELLDRFARQRDEEAFAGLMQRHGPMVLAVCRRYLQQTSDVEDAFQATFFVLAKRAGAIRKQESVGSWLYGAAYRMALKVRESAGRRRAHERPLDGGHDESMPQPEYLAVPPSELSCLEHGELRAVLDEEMQRLPEKYRAPLVLCYLEGKTNEQAARELSWTKGTVSGRLARARDLLRDRLARRGLALSSAALAGALSEQICAGAVPPGLAVSTIQSAIQFVAGEAVPAHLALLTEGALQAMTMTKLKTVAGLVLVCAGVLGLGAGLMGYQFKGSGIAAAVPTEEKKSTEIPMSKSETNPPGVPLEMRLVAKKGTYTLDLAGKTAEQLRKELKALDGGMDFPPEPPAVDLVLEIRNTGDKELSLLRGTNIGDFYPMPQLQGPGAVQVVTIPNYEKVPLNPPVKVTLKKGEKHLIPVHRLHSADKNALCDKYQSAYWTQPGEYRLSFRLGIGVFPAPKGTKDVFQINDDKFGQVQLTSNSVGLKVVEAKQQGKADPPGVPLELKLVARKDTYTLNFHGRTMEEYRKRVATSQSTKAGALPPPEVDLALEIRNTGSKDITFLNKRFALSTFDLKGPGAIQSQVFSPKYYPLRLPGAKVPAVLPREQITLAPGQSYLLENFRTLSAPDFASVASSNGGTCQAGYWTQPGEYVLTVKFSTAVKPAPKEPDRDGGFGTVQLVSNPVTLKIVTPK